MDLDGADLVGRSEEMMRVFECTFHIDFNAGGVGRQWRLWRPHQEGWRHADATDCLYDRRSGFDGRLGAEDSSTRNPWTLHPPHGPFQYQ